MISVLHKLHTATVWSIVLVLNSLFSEKLFQTERFALVFFTRSYTEAAISVITLCLIQDIGVLKASSGRANVGEEEKPVYRNYHTRIAIYHIGHFVSQFTGKSVYRYSLTYFAIVPAHQ